MSKSERDHRYVKRRREKGWCGRNGCPNKSGDDYYCEAHKKAHAARMAKARQPEVGA